jgi:dipeptidyl aminopeptidase/acylaminoacyl peptidase
MRVQRFILHLTCAILFAGISAPCRAEVGLGPAQALSYVRAGDLHISPDGSKLAYVASSYLWDAKPHIRVMDLATGTERELTPAGKSERSPQWSPDGRLLGFLSNRGGKNQIYAAPADGGEPAALTTRKFGVQGFHWSPDGETIAYLAKDDDAPSEDEGPQVADREADLSRLWLLDRATQSSRKLGRTGWRIDEFQWRDKAHLLVVATDKPGANAFVGAVYSLAVADGALSPIATPPQPFGGLFVSPDGRSMAILSTAAQGPIPRDLFIGSADGGGLKDLSVPPDRDVADVRWRDPGAIWVRVIDGFYNRIFRLSPDGAPPVRVDLALSVGSFDVAPNGDLAFVGEDYDHLPEIYLRSRDGRQRQLSHLQQAWTGGRLAATTIFHTRSFDGTPIEAALMKPAADAAAGTSRVRAPLVLLVHGGPSASFSAGYGWETAWAQMLAAHGYQVLMVNPRGSTGYSEAFLKANKGDWGGGDYKDLMAVLDGVIARGEVDPQRLGVGGWSYGGEMSTWAITQTRRFKAAVAGAGVYDQQAEFESESGPEGDEWYFGTPWDHPEVFARNSPSTYIRNARTPTLILDGADDANNPVAQSVGLYRALKHLGVETELVLYPSEGHSPRRGSYNIDMFERILGWYDKRLKPPA